MKNTQGVDTGNQIYDVLPYLQMYSEGELMCCKPSELS